MQLKALGIDENIGHCDALCGLKCILAYSHAWVIVQTTLVVALLYFFRHFHFLNVVQSNCNSENSLFSLEWKSLRPFSELILTNAQQVGLNDWVGLETDLCLRT